MTSKANISSSVARRATLLEHYWMSFNKQAFVEVLAYNTTLSEEALALAWEGIDHMVDVYGIVVDDPLCLEKFNEGNKEPLSWDSFHRVYEVVEKHDFGDAPDPTPHKGPGDVGE